VIAHSALRHSIFKPTMKSSIRAAIAATLFIACALLSAHASARHIDFLESWIYFDFNATPAVTIGDVNGDGREDLALLLNLDGTPELQVHLQNSSGSLGTGMRQGPLRNADYTTARAVDLNADGRKEIIVGLERGLLVYTWDGNGGFRATTYASDAGCPYAATGDLNLDGFPDVACLDHQGVASLYINNTRSGFAPSTSFQTAGLGHFNSASHVQLKDVTGDGWPDMLIASGMTNSFFVYPNHRMGGFWPAYAYPYPEDVDLYSHTIEAMDTDGDGSLEIIIAKTCNSPCPRILVYRRTSNGSFTLAKRLETYDGPGMLLVQDLDGDGLDDLLVSHSGWFAVGRYMSVNGQLASHERLAPIRTTHGTNIMALGDLNGDGCNDIVTGGLSVQINFGVCLSGAAADYNGDERSDIAWHNRGNGQGSLWYSANAQTQRSLRTVTDRAWTVAGRGDFDGDGSSDLLWRNSTTGANAIWKGGDYAWQIPVTTVTNTQWAVAGIGDFNFDGRDDIFWRNASTAANVIWHSGDSTTQQSVMGVSGNKWQVADIGDFDGDGRDDVLWRNTSTGANTIWKAGNYEAQQPMTPAMTAWRVAGSGDFDGDGRDDVVWRHATTGANELWPGGNATSKISLTSVTNLAWQVVAAGDYDGDGKDDLLWRNPSNGQNVIWRSANYNQQLKVDPRTGADWRVVR